MIYRAFIRVLKLGKLLAIKRRNCHLRIGRRFQFDLRTNIYAGDNKLILGDDVYLRSSPKGYHAGMPFPTTILVDGPDAECFIGDNCRINGVYIHAQKKEVIGRNSVIAAGVNILDSNGHSVFSLDRTSGRDHPEAIHIGENVWVGLNAIILKGSVIGSNSVVSAGSVVKGKFPTGSLIQGNPAKVVKMLEI